MTIPDVDIFSTDNPTLKLHTDVAEMKGMLTTALSTHSAMLTKHESSIEGLSTSVAQHGERLTAIGIRVDEVHIKVNGQLAKAMAVITPIIAAGALFLNIIQEVLKTK
jgi:hypothetical protein